MRWFALDGVGNFDNSFATTTTGARVLGQFSVSKNRMPTSGRYMSAPTLETQGALDVWAKNARGFWPFLSYPSVEFGVVLTQTLHHGSTEKTVDRYTSIVEIEDENWEYKIGFPGDIKFPPIWFDLDQDQSLLVELEVKFVYYALGSTSIVVGLSGKPLKFRLPQYDIVSV